MKKKIHVGIELGGTSCRVGISSNEEMTLITSSTIIYTTEPKETIKKICLYINGFTEVFSSVGIACFGPICLDKSSPKYGYITTTPKLAWQDFPVLKEIMNGID